VGRDSSVGVATRYGLDAAGIKPRWGSRFSGPVQTGPGAQPTSCTVGTGSFPGVKRLGRSVDHPPPSSAEVKERVELYITPPMGLRGLFWVNLTLRPTCISECILSVTGQIVDVGKNACTKIVERIETRQFCARLGEFCWCLDGKHEHDRSVYAVRTIPYLLRHSFCT